MKHQKDVLKQTEKFNRVAYYLDMGLGKTFIGAEKMIRFHTEENLLICQKSKIKDWREHFAKYYKYDISAYDLTDKKQWADFWNNPCNFRFRVGIINYELAWRRKDLQNLSDFTLMLDESSLIQNESAKRSKFILKMKPKNVVLLSGTPTGGKYENLYSQLQLLGWTISKELYWKQYIETEWVEQDGFFRKDVIGYKNVERLKQKLAAHGAIFMKIEEAGISLPEATVIPVRLKTTKEYKQFMKKRVITIDGKELVGDSALTQMLYARMLCGQYNQDKLEAFKDLLESSDDRFVVFYNFTAELVELEAIAHELNRPFSLVTGACKRLDEYEQFNNSITFVQYQAGAMGLNLQKANKTIYFTLPQASELFEQSKKRTNRIGQERPCFYYYLLCNDSVEEDVLATLEMRKDYTDELFKKYEKKKGLC
jgi:SNF2 family DNA or RNA helicase